MLNKFGASTLIDISGKPIPPGELQEEAKLRLQDFIEKNKGTFDAFFKEHGPIRPPLKYDMDNKRWIWVEENERN